MRKIIMKNRENERLNRTVNLIMRIAILSLSIYFFLYTALLCSNPRIQQQRKCFSKLGNAVCFCYACRSAHQHSFLF